MTLQDLVLVKSTITESTGLKPSVVSITENTVLLETGVSFNDRFHYMPKVIKCLCDLGLKCVYIQSNTQIRVSFLETPEHPLLLVTDPGM